MTGIIYKATSPSGKVYIGQTIRGLKRRKNIHINEAFNKNSNKYYNHFSNAIRCYGKNKFVWEVLYNDVPYSILLKLEIVIIEAYDSFNSGYNSTLGGESVMMGRKHSEKTKAKMSADRKGKPSKLKGKKWPKERKAGMIGKYAGEMNPSAKLNWEKVIEIRTLYKKGKTQKDIAKLYNVTQTTISSIILNKQWKI